MEFLLYAKDFALIISLLSLSLIHTLPSKILSGN